MTSMETITTVLGTQLIPHLTLPDLQRLQQSSKFLRAVFQAASELLPHDSWAQMAR